MSMTRYAICCEECYDKICETNKRAARLWLDLCIVQMKNAGPVNCLDAVELKTLERLGYIKTTEDLEAVKVVVNGHYGARDGNDYFCLLDGNHGV